MMKQPPASATNMVINCAGLGISLLALWWLHAAGQSLSSLQAVLLLCACYAVPIAALEAIWLKPWQAALKGRPGPGGIAPGRCAVKLLGLSATLALALLLYWALPEYRGDFYDRYYQLLRTLFPPFALLAPVYIVLVDRLARQPRDGYWHFGMWLLGRREQVERRVIAQHLLGWLVKFFFLPLMFIYLSDKVEFMRAHDFSRTFASFKAFYDISFQSLYYIDLLIVTVGYMATFTVTGSHIRSTEPTLLGWLVALACYQPFWSLASAHYLHYDAGPAWGKWFWETPVLYTAWGCLILACVIIYVWASIPFGIRFSNLTHRGILTNGPYRFCKHPAYLSKNISWWLISTPFMVSTHWTESLRHCLLLLLLNGIYFLRARTEERHLSSDPVYVAYAEYIEQHGILRRLGDWMPVLRFAPGRLLNLPESTGGR